jgi:hypothetical protein
LKKDIFVCLRHLYRVSLRHFHVYVHYILNWFISSIFPLTTFILFLARENLESDLTLANATCHSLFSLWGNYISKYFSMFSQVLFNQFILKLESRKYKKCINPLHVKSSLIFKSILGFWISGLGVVNMIIWLKANLSFKF